MTPLEVFSICSAAVALTAIPLGICACAFYSRRIADALRLFGERDITLVIKRLHVSLPKEEVDTPPQKGRPQ